RRHTRSKRDWSSDVCSSDLSPIVVRDKQCRISRYGGTPKRQPGEYTIFRPIAMPALLSPRYPHNPANVNMQIRGSAGSVGIILKIGRASCREGVYVWSVDVG